MQKYLFAATFSIALMSYESGLPQKELLAGGPPSLGQKAPQFELKQLESKEKLSLSRVLKKQPVVLVVLRGYPGYQCPICTRQVGALLQEKEKLMTAGAKVILVYPGLSEGLEQRATEFFQKHALPENFVVVTDPDYMFTNAYGLRWNAPRETAYPSTFVIDQSGKIVAAKVSMTHGGRSKPEMILHALDQL